MDASAMGPILSSSEENKMNYKVSEFDFWYFWEVYEEEDEFVLVGRLQGPGCLCLIIDDLFMYIYSE